MLSLNEGRKCAQRCYSPNWHENQKLNRLGVGPVGVPCFDSLENKNTRKHHNQSLELQDLVLLFSERDFSNVCLQRFILCAFGIGFRLVIKCRCLFVCLVGWNDTVEHERPRKDI